VASLWAVNDRSTMRLMSGFYGRLLSTEGSRRDGGRGFPGLSRVEGSPAADKATALADAQRDLIGRGGRYSHPYFWGAFVLVGQVK
jgi:CHAT domain-containing protein